MLRQAVGKNRLYLQYYLYLIIHRSWVHVNVLLDVLTE